MNERKGGLIQPILTIHHREPILSGFDPGPLIIVRDELTGEELGSGSVVGISSALARAGWDRLLEKEFLRGQELGLQQEHLLEKEFLRGQESGRQQEQMKHEREQESDDGPPDIIFTSSSA